MLIFTVAMVALQIVTTQGSEMGWTNPITLGLGALVLVLGPLFFGLSPKPEIPS
jgi:DHA2 family multidrug resistance protein-like MFS transporter